MYLFTFHIIKKGGLKEGLTVDELDRAIYKFYEHFCQGSLGKKETRGNNKGHELVAQKIGKSAVRVQKAIDRFEFICLIN